MRNYTIILILSFVAGNSHATTGNDYFKNCKDYINSDFALWCIGYVQGYGESISFYGQKKQIEKYCLPQGATTDQAIDVVNLYLTNNPQLRHQHLPKLIGAALSKAFPCNN